MNTPRNSKPKKEKVQNDCRLNIEVDCDTFAEIKAAGAENDRLPGPQARNILKQWAKARKTLKGQS